MTLRKLNDRHLEIIRRLVVGEPDGDICIETGISASHLSTLKNKEPLFAEKLAEIRRRVDEQFIETRAEAREILEEAAPHAARLHRTAVIDGKLGGEPLEPKLRLDSAWDILKGTGVVDAASRLVAHVDITEIIQEAYKRKYKSDKGDQLPVSPTRVIDITPKRKPKPEPKQLNLFEEDSKWPLVKTSV